jgi:TfoX/Sxy family transcriptional regulator of competence genes
VACDEALAERVRALVAGEPGVVEKRMFGGLAFLVNGNMAVSASGQGGLLLRVDPAESDELVAGSPAYVAEMRGRAMPGWLRLDSVDVEGDGALAEWVARCVSFARSLPAKR